MAEQSKKPPEGRRFKPGEAHNPKGSSGVMRKRTSVRMLLRDTVVDLLPALIAKLNEQALAGDTNAARLLLDRGLPTLRAETAPIKIPAAVEATTLTDKGRAIVDAAASGEVSPSAAGDLLGGLVGVSHLVEIDEQQRSIDELRDAVRARGLDPDEFV